MNTDYNCPLCKRLNYTALLPICSQCWEWFDVIVLGHIIIPFGWDNWKGKAISLANEVAKDPDILYSL